jgi:hypothetical protein
MAGQTESLADKVLVLLRKHVQRPVDPSCVSALHLAELCRVFYFTLPDFLLSITYRVSRQRGHEIQTTQQPTTG